MTKAYKAREVVGGVYAITNTQYRGAIDRIQPEFAGE